ncbi:MAG: response regulator [Desulfobacterales bacterium]|jgi:DNA-binding NtrC family response regulator
MVKIVVLDDVLDAGILAQRVLSAADREIEVFTEEEDFLTYVRENPVDLVILDIKLKKMSGIEVLEELKAVKSDIPAIILTGYPTLETARDALRLGVAEYCVKPIDNDELEEKVAAVLTASIQ